MRVFPSSIRTGIATFISRSGRARRARSSGEDFFTRSARASCESAFSNGFARIEQYHTRKHIEHATNLPAATRALSLLCRLPLLSRLFRFSFLCHRSEKILQNFQGVQFFRRPSQKNCIGMFIISRPRALHNKISRKSVDNSF